jgi:hypothetical protein
MEVLLPLAIIEGDCDTEPGRGGGPINDSVSGSGEIDSDAEPSRL